MISRSWFRTAPEDSSTPLHTISYWYARISRDPFVSLQPTLRHGDRVRGELILPGSHLFHTLEMIYKQKRYAFLTNIKALAQLIADQSCVFARELFLVGMKNMTSPGTRPAI